jgi:hypothetical protein
MLLVLGGARPALFLFLRRAMNFSVVLTCRASPGFPWSSRASCPEMTGRKGQSQRKASAGKPAVCTGPLAQRRPRDFTADGGQVLRTMPLTPAMMERGGAHAATRSSQVLTVRAVPVTVTVRSRG